MTKYQLCGDILKAWHASGLEFDGKNGKSEGENLALFGLPLSDLQTEQIQGKEYQVQWFERARFELHPENAAPYNVLLGLLGNEIRDNSGTPTLAPPAQPKPLPAPSFNACQPDPNPDAAPNYPVQIVGINKSSEVVTLKNVSPDPISLDGWHMCSIKGNQEHAIAQRCAGYRVRQVRGIMPSRGARSWQLNANPLGGPAWSVVSARDGVGEVSEIDSALRIGRRVVVTGMAGAGKSTFARQLSAKTGLPAIHLDVHFWKPGWVEPSDQEWRAVQSTLLAGEAWIADGNYHETLELRLERADTVVFLDTPWWVCAARAFVRGLRRPEGQLPDGCDTTAWRRLRDEWWLVWRVWLGRRSEPERELAIVARHGGHVALHVLRSKGAIRAFLDQA